MPLLMQSFSPVTVQQVRLLASDKTFIEGSTKNQLAIMKRVADGLGVTDMEIAILMSADDDDIDRYGRPRQ